MCLYFEGNAQTGRERKMFFQEINFLLKEVLFDFQNQSDGGKHGEKEIESNIVCSVENTLMQFIALLIPAELALSGCDFCQSEMI